MAILLMINRFPDFLQYIVLENIAPFRDVISLSQTCIDLHKWVIKSFKAYYILSLYYKLKNITLLSESNLYKNKKERKLFQIIYRLYKNKNTSFGDIANGNSIPILDWWVVESKTHITYPVNAIDDASYCRKIDVLNWWLNAAVEYPNIITLQYSEKTIDNASRYGEINILNWWLNAAIEYPNIIILKYTEKAIDEAYYYNTTNIEVFDWWLNAAIKYPNIISLKYTEKAIDNASRFGYINILNWWLKAAIKYPNIITLKYTEKAIDCASCNKHINVLNWWKNISSKYPDIITLKYSYKAISTDLEIIQWWVNSGLELKIPCDYINRIRESYGKVYMWLTSSGDLSKII